MEIKPAPTSKIYSDSNSKLDFLKSHFGKTRSQTEYICQPLEIEDYVVQPIVDVSPPKWHLAHTTWFFEEMLLVPFFSGYKVFNKSYSYLFNSYYETVGERVLRPNRGNMTRPSVDEIYEYRHYVDQCMLEFMEKGTHSDEILDLIELGLNHEQQHQELLITDIKYILGHNPIFPVYKDDIIDETMNGSDQEIAWIEVQEGVYDIGFEGDTFHFDNEAGQHKVYLHHFKIMDRLITNGEFLQFIEDGGYEDFRWWLSEAWDWVNKSEINGPMYWHKIEGTWMNYKLSGLKTLNMSEPVTHLSHFEADAFAQWKGARLPTEFEWEVAASLFGNDLNLGTFQEDGLFHPKQRRKMSSQFLGDVWEWTNSAYLPFPFYTRAPGAVGEYNGKFMVNQKVLRGGSCATPRSHIRLTYRNFFQPNLRWQFNGLRLAQTI